jgi:hypothetical protein
MESVFFIDFEAFQHGEESFQVKELCVLDAAKPLNPLYLLFKPPMSWSDLNHEQKRTYAYQEHNLHHIAWNEGRDERYCGSCLKHRIMKEFPLAASPESVCYVLGNQKADFLQDELPELNIMEYVYACAYKDLPHAPNHLTCIYRNHSREHCATLKCYRMYNTYRANVRH